MSCWLLIIFVISLSVTLGEIQVDSWNVLSTSVFFLLGWQLLVLLLMYYSFCSLYLLLAKLFVIVYLLPNFEFYWSCLEGILVLLFGMYSLWCLLSFFVLAFVKFLLFRSQTIFILSHFFLTISNSHGILQSAFGLVGMHSAAASMWAVTKFSYSSFGVSIANISIGKWGPVVACDFDCILLLWKLSCILALTILWLGGISLKREYVSYIRALFIHFLFMSI